MIHLKGLMDLFWLFNPPFFLLYFHVRSSSSLQSEINGKRHPLNEAPAPWNLSSGRTTFCESCSFSRASWSGRTRFLSSRTYCSRLTAREGGCWGPVFGGAGGP